jgi:outer membrane protein assembly factor BamB
MSVVTRRELLAFSGTAIGTAAMGGTVHATQTQPTDWPQFQFDSANTGYMPDYSGPVAGVEQQWEFTTFAGEWLSTVPVVVDGWVVLASEDGLLRSLGAATGEEQWKYDTGSEFRSTPIVGDGTVFAGSNDGTLHAVDLETGDQQWSVGLQEPDTKIRYNYTNGKLIGQRNSGVAAFNPADGNVLWETDVAPPLGGTAVANGTVYVTENQSNRIVAFNESDGSQVWETQINGRFPWSAPPVVSDGRVITTTEQGNLFVFDATSGEQIGTNSEGESEEQDATPAVDGERVYHATDQGQLYAVVSGSGEIAWQTEFPNAVRASPIVLGNTVYVGTMESGTVYAIEAETGTQRWSYSLGRNIVSLASDGEWLYAVMSDGDVVALGPGGGSSSDTQSSTTGGDTSGGGGDTSSGTQDQTSSDSTTQQRGFFSNTGNEPEFISNPFNMTTAGFLLSVGGIIYQMMEGE